MASLLVVAIRGGGALSTAAAIDAAVVNGTTKANDNFMMPLFCLRVCKYKGIMFLVSASDSVRTTLVAAASASSSTSSSSSSSSASVPPPSVVVVRAISAVASAPTFVPLVAALFPPFVVPSM